MKNWNFTNDWSLKTARVNSVSCLMIMNFIITVNPARAVEQETLPVEFLEFLAEGIVIEDEYLDPINYDEIKQAGSADETTTDDNGAEPNAVPHPVFDPVEEVDNNEK